MARLTVTVNDEHDEFLSEISDKHDQSKAWALRQILDAVQGNDTVLTGVVQSGEAFTTYHQSGEDVESLQERIEELEERFDKLEADDDPTSGLDTDSREHESRGRDRGVDEPVGKESVATDIESLTLTGSAGSSDGRAALRAMYEYLRTNERAQKSDFITDVYPDNPAGYGSGESWWQAVGRENDRSDGFVTLARQREDLRPPAGKGSQYFVFTG